MGWFGPSGACIKMPSKCPRNAHGGAIFVMNADGSGAQQIHPNGGPPCWSPDGKILFSDSGLWTINVDGSNASKIADGTFSTPHWGPAAP